MDKLLRKLQDAIENGNPRSFNNAGSYIDFTFNNDYDRDTFKEYLSEKINYDEIDLFGYPAIRIYCD